MKNPYIDWSRPQTATVAWLEVDVENYHQVLTMCRDLDLPRQGKNDAFWAIDKKGLRQLRAEADRRGWTVR